VPPATPSAIPSTPAAVAPPAAFGSPAATLPPDPSMPPVATPDIPAATSPGVAPGVPPRRPDRNYRPGGTSSYRRAGDVDGEVQPASFEIPPAAAAPAVIGPGSSEPGFTSP
jgi:hypothetical protein